MGGSATDLVRRRLTGDLVAERFRPGDRIDEVSYAKEVGVSRTPMREALRQLESLGLVDCQNNRGAKVPSNVRGDLFEVVAEITVLCARFAVDRMPADQRRALPEMLEKGEDWVAFLFQHCGNSVLSNLADSLWETFRAARETGRLTPQSGIQGARRLAQAVADGDLSQLEAASRHFIDQLALALR